LKKAISIISFLLSGFLVFLLVIGSQTFLRFNILLDKGISYQVSAEFLVSLVLDLVLALLSILFFRFGVRLFKKSKLVA
tara:strand:- start:7880 stop:8116 length:237 start_codon:yes stop_codon:yes gene_type:complete